MAESKKYYWLKLPKDFFEDRAIKKLRSIAGGDTYTIIYLKMLLRTLEDGGKFVYEGIEDSIIEEIALDIDEKEEDVSVAVNYLIKKGLMICTDNEAELTRMHEMIGSETDKAKLMRKKREQSNNVTQNGNNVTHLLPDVTNCYTEKEKEIDKELDIKETTTNVVVKKKRQKFEKPTKQQVDDYCRELKVTFDSEKFIDYYESKSWYVGKSPMKDWKATVRNWLRQEKKLVSSSERDSTLDDIF